MSLLDILNTLMGIPLVMMEIAIPAAMLASSLPKRGHAWPSFALAFAVLTVCAALLYKPVTGVSSYGSAAINQWNIRTVLFFAGVLLAFAAVVLYAFDTSTWQALFCATAGYTIQNLASAAGICIGVLGQMAGLPQAVFANDTLCELLAIAVVYPLCYHFFIRNVRERNLAMASDRSMIVMALLVAVTVIGLDVAIKALSSWSVSNLNILSLRAPHVLICIFVLYCEYKVLYGQQLAIEMEATRRIMAERERQYNLSRSNIEAINIKCHDIRHQIHHLAIGASSVDQDVLDDIAHEVDVYDSTVETGNEALNTVLTEIGLTTEREGISLACIADGAALNFMRPTDLYALFGNILENALEAVRQVEDPERRIITLTVRRRGNMVAISTENYCKHAPKFRDGLPVSTKGDDINHGFGTRSIRSIVEQYAGSVNMGVKDDVFYVNALVADPNAVAA